MIVSSDRMPEPPTVRRRRGHAAASDEPVDWRCNRGDRVQNLSKRFGTFQAVNDVSFEVPAGQLVALLGPVGLGQEHDPADHRRAWSRPTRATSS